MNINKLIELIKYWAKKIFEYLLFNKVLIKAYLNQYKGETAQSLVGKLAKGFVKQTAKEKMSDYVESYITDSLKSFKDKAKDTCTNACKAMTSFVKRIGSGKIFKSKNQMGVI